MRQPKTKLELRGSTAGVVKTTEAANSQMPRLIGKLRRLFGSKPAGKTDRKDRGSKHASSGTMTCPHGKLKKSCSTDCSSVYVLPVSNFKHPGHMQERNTNASRTSPAMSDCSRSSLTSSSTSSSSSANERHIRFSDEVLVRDACSRDDVSSLSSLLGETASRNASMVSEMRQNAFGRTLLHEATHRGSAEMVNVLLRYGSDPNAPDSFGDRPLHAAAIRGSYEIAEKLLSCGAKVHLFNSELQLPVDISRARQDHRMIRLLSDAAHAQAAYECHQARRDAGMLGPHVVAAVPNQHMRRPSVDGAMQTLTKFQNESARSRNALRRLASDETQRRGPERPFRPQVHFSHHSPVPVLSHQTVNTSCYSGLQRHHSPSLDVCPMGDANIVVSKTSYSNFKPANDVIAHARTESAPQSYQHRLLTQHHIPCPLTQTQKHPSANLRQYVGFHQMMWPKQPDSGTGRICDVTSIEI